MTTTTTTAGNMGSIMGVGAGVGDYAADVTYSTKPNAPLLGTGLMTTTTTTRNVVGTPGSIIGVGGGVGDYAADVTYSTKPNAQLIYGGLPM